MQVIIWWDYENNPSKPWMYELMYSNQTMSGCCVSLSAVWREIDMFMVPSVIVIQDNKPQFVQ